MKILKLAEKFEKELNPEIVVEEHDTQVKSYMAVSNLENIIADSKQLLEIMNDEDDFPQWVDELLAIARQNVSKALGYVRSEKTIYAALEKEDMVKFAAGKYDHIDFKPPQSVADAAKRGLELRKKNKGKGGLSSQQASKEGIGSGVARAVSLSNRKNLNESLF